MTLTPGTRLGPYELVGQIGAGGMGEVWKAKDTRLDRFVAVKVLPEHLSTNLEAMARFEREAKAVAALNHPNITGIHDFATHGETPYVVMELLEGESLRTRLREGPFTPARATELAIQLAEGLSAAHEKGLIHRDLKPDNLWITKEGRLKILDFGLAKQIAPMGSSSDSYLPTQAMSPGHHTQVGIILGTAAYMSPEQAKGKSVDKRADIWAFGVVLFEMLTGRPLFVGESISDVLAAVLRQDIPDDSLPQDLPPSLRKVLRRCLTRDPRQRFHDIEDARLELEEPAPVEPAPAALLTPAAHWKAWLPWACVALLAIALPLLWPRSTKVTAPLLEVELAPPKAVIPTHLALSPDGRHLLLEGISENQQKKTIWTRSMDQTVWTQVPGSEGGMAPFWSHDGHAIAFVASGKLQWVPATGGTPQVICEAGAINGPGTWGADNTIVFTRYAEQPLWKVPAGGGAPQALARLESGVASYLNPHFLPDGRHLLFNKLLALDSKQRLTQDGELWGLDLATGKATRICQGVGEGYGLATGWVVVLRGDELVAQRMDLQTFQLRGESRSLASKVEVDTGRGLWGIFSIASSGLLVYLPELPAPLRQFTWLDLEGHRLGTAGEPSRVFGVRGINLSRDGLRVAYGQEASHHEVDLWTLDLQRGISSRLTFDGQFLSGGRGRALWSVDGKEIYLLGAQGLLAQDAFLAGKQRVLASGRYTPFSVTPDGKQILLVGANPETGNDILTLSIPGPGVPKPFLATAANELQPRLSPDGRWLAYLSDESGAMEVFVVDYPGATTKVQVSSGGGADPFWLGRSGALVYRKDSAFFALSIQGKAGTIQVGPPRKLLAQLSPEMATQMALFSPIYPRLLVADPEGKRLLAPLMTLEALQPKTLRLSTTWMSKLEGK